MRYFLAPDVLASVPADELTRAEFLRYRAPYLRSLAKAFVRNPPVSCLP